MLIVTCQATTGKCDYSISSTIYSEGLHWGTNYFSNASIQLLEGDQLRVEFKVQYGGNCPPDNNAYFFNGDTIELIAPPVIYVDQPGTHHFEIYYDIGSDYEVLAEYTFTIIQPEATPVSCGLSISALLGGAMDPDTSRYSWMRDDLRKDGYLPAQEPYTGLGYAVTQGAGSTADSIALADHNSPLRDAVDWVLIELRDTADPSLVLHSNVALISRAGWMYFDLDLIPGKYYVSLRHRNHLGILTSVPVPLSNYIIQFDLRRPDFPVFGSQPRMDVPFGQKALWLGNVIDDDEVKYVGMDNDRDAILVEIGGVVPTNTVSGYLNSDLNLDGMTKYSGQNNDRDIILQTIGGIIPTVTRMEQLP